MIAHGTVCVMPEPAIRADQVCTDETGRHEATRRQYRARGFEHAPITVVESHRGHRARESRAATNHRERAVKTYDVMMPAEIVDLPLEYCGRYRHAIPAQRCNAMKIEYANRLSALGGPRDVS